MPAFPGAKDLTDSLLISRTSPMHLFDLSFENLEVKFEEDASFAVELDALVKIFLRSGLIALQQMCKPATCVSQRR